MEENKIICRVFWVQTPTALVMRKQINPEEFNSVAYMESEYQDGGREINEIKKGSFWGRK